MELAGRSAPLVKRCEDHGAESFSSDKSDLPVRGSCWPVRNKERFYETKRESAAGFGVKGFKLAPRCLRCLAGFTGR